MRLGSFIDSTIAKKAFLLKRDKAFLGDLMEMKRSSVDRSIESIREFIFLSRHTINKFWNKF